MTDLTPYTPYLTALLVAVLGYGATRLEQARLARQLAAQAEKDRALLATQAKEDREALAASVIAKADTLAATAYREQEAQASRDARTRELLAEFSARTGRFEDASTKQGEHIRELVNSRLTEALDRIKALEARLGVVTQGREGTAPEEKT